MSHHGHDHNHGIPAGNLPAGGEPAIGNSAVTSGQIENPTHRTSPNELHTQANNPTGNGVLRRGDRRDTHPSFSTGKAGRGSNTGGQRDGGRSGPLGASGRKSGPKNG